MKLTRRTFFKLGGATGAMTLVAAPRATAAPARLPGAGMKAVLVDTTKCVGCRACEAACSEANRLPEPDLPGDERIFAARRTTGTRAFTVVNRFEGTGGAPTRFVKSQCMHCVEPACASACLARALEKTAAGPVVYHGDRCLGCRYCMVACPFDVPKYEYDSPSPFVRKCTFCAERQAQGLEPACTSVCPSGALTFGTRAALVEEARRRVYGQPEKYVAHIYGEQEAGGTSWLYISDRPLERLGFTSNVPTVAFSSLAQPALAAVPFILTLWPPLLMGLYSFSRRRAATEPTERGPRAMDAPETPEEMRHA
jgi:Fe-S-cluster-containing dehydrogenase component